MPAKDALVATAPYIDTKFTNGQNMSDAFSEPVPQGKLMNLEETDK